MKKSLQYVSYTCLLIFCSFLFSTKSFSQNLDFGRGKTKVEAGINVGPSFFLGDLGGNAGKGTRFIKDINFELTQIIKGVFLTVYPNQWLGFRLTAQIGSLKGEDYVINTKGVNELWRKQRNLDFRSTLKEAYFVTEFYPLNLLNMIEDFNPRVQPYCMLGVGLFRFNPQGSLTAPNGNKTWYDLKPLRTEGEGMTEYPDIKEYSLTQVNIPMGAGVKYIISERINTSVELILRKTFTDYIDDVSANYIDPNLFDKYLSPQDAVIARQIQDKTYGIITPGLNRYEPGTQRGNPRQNDSYFSLLFKVGIRLGPVARSFGKNTGMDLQCPHRF
jgi:hypothetical protein